MTAELKLLAASVVLGLVHLIASSHLISWQRGYRWTASSREGQAPPLSGVANRVDQATTNFLETFPFFVDCLELRMKSNSMVPAALPFVAEGR